MLLESLIYFIGGIGLFLYGMKLMSDGLELSTGTKLKKILEILTSNKFFGVLVGFGITAIIQSSTATTVMVVGFVNAGLMNLTQAVGVIIGANIGTTTTGLMIALNLHTIAPIFIFIGAILLLFAKKKKFKHIGMAIIGFGLLFFGMKIMSDAMKPLSDLPWVIDIFRFAENPLFGIALGIVITAIVQSSTASIGILIAATMAGVVTDLNQAIFILYGQNIGTCLTAMIASMGSNKMARKAALIHFIYNIIGIIIIVIITFLPIGFIDFIKGLSDNVSTQFVYSHIIINIIMAVILLPFSKFIIKIAEMIIKGKDKEKSDIAFEYIDERLIDNPALAIVQAYKEVERNAKLTLENYILTQNIILNKSKDTGMDMKKIYKNENMINLLGGKINRYLTKLNSKDLEYIDVKLIASLYRVITDVERMGNHCMNIIKTYKELVKNNKMFSCEAIKELDSMFKNVEIGFEKSIEIFIGGEYNSKKILEVKNLEEIVDAQKEEYKNNHIERVNNGYGDSVSGIEFVQILTALERISDYTCNIVYSLHYKKSK